MNSTSNVSDSTDHALNVETNTNNPYTPKRGFQHVYKSTKTSSSLRVCAAHNASVKHNTPRTDNAMKRHRKKMKKINQLKHILPSPQHSITYESLKSQPVFFSGTSKRMIPNCPAYACVLSATEALVAVDTVHGAQMILENGDLVFILIP